MRPTSRPEKPYTNQEIVDRVYQHFFVEKHERCHDGRYCQYTKVDEKRDGCAVGCLITNDDALLLPQADIGLGFRKLAGIYFENRSEMLLADLQHWHDNDEMDPGRFSTIIEEYGLIHPEKLNESNI